MNEKLFHIFTDMATRYEKIEDIYRAKAYHNAAEAVLLLPGSAREMRNALKTPHPNIGRGTHAKILEYLTTHKIAEYEKLKTIPHLSAVELFCTISGVGPVTANEWIRARIYTIADLKRAMRKGVIALTRAQELGLVHYADLHERIPRAEVELIYSAIERAVVGVATVPIRTVLCGSWRRGARTSGDVDILAYDISATHMQTLLATLAREFVADERAIGTIAQGDYKYTFLWRTLRGVVRQVDLYYCPVGEMIPNLLYLTGSSTHNQYIRALCKSRGMTLNQHGLFRGTEHIPLETEKDVYKILEIEYVAPQNR